ncbi:arginyltransferase [Psychrobacter sp. FDAARGOS_221]|uniref:arginyltransferase n=1 Tax=Psychrobacter sp. FDAARGOS_221 TaxID=1975705 RepID=UPI000BB55387|nr:arginyltransferase [Psychrobacter sp. FDAARGOS_221]PNK60140.1 arginyltransferase [Psychrobacter sp. FDAARGOS_221]
MQQASDHNPGLTLSRLNSDHKNTERADNTPTDRSDEISPNQNISDKQDSDDLVEQHPLYLSPPSLCSYLPDRASQLTFMLLPEAQGIDRLLYTYLSHQGFRRSGKAIYRPNCHHCQQCIASRVVVNDFHPSRRYRRVLNRNAQVSINIIDASKATQEHYGLYQKYISARHADGDMYPPSLHTFEQFLIDSPADTVFMEFREPNNKLLAVAVTDKLSDGLSSIYTFFDPDPSYHSRSLGVFCILQQIEMAKSLGLTYAYLGYWIPSVKKMSYKTEYAPIELLINQQWLRFETQPNHNEVLALLNTKPVQLQS